MEALFANACRRVAVVTRDPDMILAAGSHHNPADDLVQGPPASRLLGAVEAFQ